MSHLSAVNQELFAKNVTKPLEHFAFELNQLYIKVGSVRCVQESVTLKANLIALIFITQETKCLN